MNIPIDSHQTRRPHLSLSLPYPILPYSNLCYTYIHTVRPFIRICIKGIKMIKNIKITPFPPYTKHTNSPTHPYPEFPNKYILPPQKTKPRYCKDPLTSSLFYQPLGFEGEGLWETKYDHMPWYMFT